MRISQELGDRAAITLSGLCVLHCLFVPLFAVSLPVVTALGMDDESFHIWMVVAVVPISTITLWMGCKRHGRYQVLFLGGAGLLVLCAALWSHELLGETGEKLFTVIGALLVASGHLRNHLLCRSVDACECGE